MSLLKPTRIGWSIALIVVSPLLFGAAASQLGGGASATRGPFPGTMVIVGPVEAVAGYTRRRIYTGQVAAYRSSTLGFERAGLLAEVLVRSGDAVKAGDVVARLDTALLDARRAELEAAMADAQARLALAETTLSRYLGLVSDGAVTRQAVDEAEQAASAAQAGVALARARLDSLAVDIGKSALRAPYDGFVSARLADEGQVVAAGEPVIDLRESITPEVRIGLPTAHKLSPGGQYTLRWRGRRLQANLRTHLPVRSTTTRTIAAIFLPSDPPDELYPGELVELELTEWVAEPGFWLPIGALAEGRRGLWTVYTVEASSPPPRGIIADHRIAPRPVEVLYQDDARVFVRGTLEADASIVLDGVHLVVPGQWVRIRIVEPEPLQSFVD